jgi:hypothetical protein
MIYPTLNASSRLKLCAKAIGCAVIGLPLLLGSVPAGAVLFNAYDGFNIGAGTNNAASQWQYYALPNSGAAGSATLLTDFQTSGNEIFGDGATTPSEPAGSFPQWDNNLVNGAYPFVQITPPTGGPWDGQFGPTPAVTNGQLIIHPTNGTSSDSAVAVAWKNLSGVAVTIDYNITLTDALTGGSASAPASDGIDFFISRELSGQTNFSTIASGTLLNGFSPVTFTGTIVLEAGELLYAGIDNGSGNLFDWDHTLLDFTVDTQEETVTVPEPASGLIVLVGLGLMGLRHRRNRRADI